MRDSQHSGLSIGLSKCKDAFRWDAVPSHKGKTKVSCKKLGAPKHKDALYKG